VRLTNLRISEVLNSSLLSTRNALKCYSRSRDYCTSGKHIVNMCLNVIKVNVNWFDCLTITFTVSVLVLGKCFIGQLVSCSKLCE
jgi:hypothetical protein